uniref:PH domain-containing protein n=1 Tax=Amphiprion ocellaris TaxID=80972 RepID=A0AAQ5YGH2_AMPOC
KDDLSHFLFPPCSSHPGGFIFKQWKKRFLLLTAEGSLLVCHDVSSPPDQLVQLQGGCDAIVEGKEILDLPKLPSGGCRDCCFALILPQNKYLLLLAETPADCRSGAHCTLSSSQSNSVHFYLYCTKS